MVPKLQYNLFSILTALENDWDLTTTKDKQGMKCITLQKGNCKLVFNKRLRTGKNGKYLAGLTMEKPEQKEATYITLEKVNKIATDVLHRCLGHVSEVLTRATAKHMGV